MNGNKVKEPLFHISRRPSIERWKAWGIRLIGILLALVACGVVVFALTKLNPVKVYGTMWQGAFGSKRKSWNTIRDAMLLLCTGVALAPAFKMRFWNIGAEGQILVGGIATAACMIYFGNTVPTWILLIVMAVVSMIAGAVWGLVPAVFQSRWGTNETLFTLMMNYVAIQLTNFFVSKWETPKGSNSVGLINMETKGGWFPEVFGQQYMLNVILVLAITVLMFVYLRWSKQGYEIAVVGESVNTAKYAGIKVNKVIMRTMAISGAVCGLAGFITVAGSSHTISADVGGGRGFTAIIVAWLAKFNTFVMVLISFLLVFLEQGAAEIASKYDLNDYTSQMLTGIILFFILGTEFFINYKINFRHKKAEEGEK